MRTIHPTWVLMLSSLILSACGASAGPSTSVSITMTEFTFLPNTLSVPAWQDITITVTNTGAVAHDLMIMKQGKEILGHDDLEDGRADAYWSQEALEPGESLVSTFVAPTVPGEYQIVCGVAGHLEAGMVGKLIVVAAP